MKTHSISLSLLVMCVTLVAVPAMAQQQIMYDNGPVNGQVNARLINYGNAVTNSFQNNNGLLLFSGFSFYVWMFPGDTISQLDVSIGSNPYGTDLYHNTFYGVGQGGSCFINRLGYNVCELSFDCYVPVSSKAWLTVQNAIVSNDDPVYWDQNSGVGCMSQGCPSKAAEKGYGTSPTTLISSETFTTYGIMIARSASKTATTH